MLCIDYVKAAQSSSNAAADSTNPRQGELYMKLKTPDIPAELVITEDLTSYLTKADDESDLSCMHIKNIRLQKNDLSAFTFKKVIFEHCRLLDCDMSGISCTDVVFRHCDLSNSDMTDGYFCRCEFSDCRLIGIMLVSTGMHDIKLSGCNLKYAAIEKSKLCDIEINDCNFSEAGITECKLKNFEATASQFIRTTFFKTSLAGIDFSENEIGGLILSENSSEIRGAIVNPLQAVDLAKRLGIIIK